MTDADRIWQRRRLSAGLTNTETSAMFSSSQMLIYVADPAASTAFYRSLFDREPVEASPNFAAFDLDGFTLALWARDKVEPAADRAGSSAELVLIVDQAGAVDRRAAPRSARHPQDALPNKPVVPSAALCSIAPDAPAHNLHIASEEEAAEAARRPKALHKLRRARE